MSCWSTSIVSISSKTCCQRHWTTSNQWRSDGVVVSPQRSKHEKLQFHWDEQYEHWLIGSSHVTKKGVIVSKVTRAIPSWSPDWFNFVPALLLASSCQVYKLWFLVVQSHVFDDLFPALPCFGQETRAELNRGLRGSFPNFPHLWLQQNLRTWPRNILAKEMDLSRIWNSPRLDYLYLFWQIATKKGGFSDCLPLQTVLPSKSSNSRSQRVM